MRRQRDVIQKKTECAVGLLRSSGKVKNNKLNALVLNARCDILSNI